MTNARSYYETLATINTDSDLLKSLSGGVSTLATAGNALTSAPGYTAPVLRGAADVLSLGRVVTVLKNAPTIGPLIKAADATAKSFAATLDNAAYRLEQLDHRWLTPQRKFGDADQAMQVINPAVQALDERVDARVNEAYMLYGHMVTKDLPGRSAIASRIDAFHEVADGWLAVRAALMGNMQTELAAAKALLDGIEALMPDLSEVQQTATDVSAIFGPVKRAFEDLEDAICVSVVGVDVCDVLDTFSSLIGFVQDAILGVIDTALQELGIDISAEVSTLASRLAGTADFLDDINTLFNAPTTDMDTILAHLEGLIDTSIPDVIARISTVVDHQSGGPGVFSLFRETQAGNDGENVLVGGDQEDALFGFFGSDELWGLEGNDFLFGGFSADKLFGYDGRDELYGGQGRDEMYGGRGNDLMFGEWQKDLMYGEQGADRINGGGGGDRIYGGPGGDTILGGPGRDKIYGEDGFDNLFGGQGNDRISGGKGNDQLSGEAGNDRLYGGLGKDRFIFDTDSGFDRILDFADRQDVIVLDGVAGFGSVSVSGTGVLSGTTGWSDTYISWNGGAASVTLSGVNPDTIGAADFVFV